MCVLSCGRFSRITVRTSEIVGKYNRVIFFSITPTDPDCGMSFFFFAVFGLDDARVELAVCIPRVAKLLAWKRVRYLLNYALVCVEV